MMGACIVYLYSVAQQTNECLSWVLKIALNAHAVLMSFTGQPNFVDVALVCQKTSFGVNTAAAVGFTRCTPKLRVRLCGDAGGTPADFNLLFDALRQNKYMALLFTPLILNSC